MKLGVEVRKGFLADQLSDEGIKIKTSVAEEWIPARTILWAAGISASRLGARVAEESSALTDRGGRVIVEDDFTIPGHPEIYVVGDLAAYGHLDGSSLRGTADVAIAEGRYVARSIRRRSQGKAPGLFKFRDRGTLGVIGRSAAVVDLFGKVPIQGRLAWYIWLFVHIMTLVSHQNRITVLVQWAWSFFTRNRSARLITGSTRSPFDRT